MSPVVGGHHGVPAGTIIGPSGLHSCLCVDVYRCTCVIQKTGLCGNGAGRARHKGNTAFTVYLLKIHQEVLKYPTKPFALKIIPQAQVYNGVILQINASFYKHINPSYIPNCKK